MRIHPDYRQGKGGRWRWFLIDHDEKTRGLAPVRGFNSMQEAEKDFREIEESLNSNAGRPYVIGAVIACVIAFALGLATGCGLTSNLNDLL